MAEKVTQHPLCKDLKVVAPEGPAWEDLVDRSPAPMAAAPAPKPLSPSREEDLREKRMASYMTHELRAPLTSIRSALGILEMQLASRLSPEERQIFSMAVRNADRLDGLINDIMDFSKVRAGKMDMQFENCRPEELLQEAIDSLRSWSVAKGLRIARVDSDEPVPSVRADRRRTVQVLTNLLSNAIKFTPTGGRIELSAACGKFEHRGTVVFRVKDSGAGIPNADLERIFSSFEQSALGSKQGSGTGLGLTLAKAMVELQEGKIWAESWRGLGAELFFTLPITAGDPTAKVRTYPKARNYSGLLAGLFKRLNAFVAIFT